MGCVNLRNASYQIFNVQYSKEEYEEKIKELDADTIRLRLQGDNDELIKANPNKSIYEF